MSTVRIRMKVRDSARLQTAVKQSPLKQGRIAEIAGTTPANLSMIMAGRNTCPPLVAARLARMIDVELDELFATEVHIAANDPAALVPGLRVKVPA